MDERLRTFVWILGSGCFGAALGILFGGLAGLLYWRSGKASGSRLAHRLIAAFVRLSRRDLSHTAKGGLVGAVDGFLFLGTVGTILGAITILGGGVPGEMIRPALWLSLLLVGGATFFGMFAYTLTHAGVRALAPVAVAGVIGAALGSFLGGLGGLLLGVVLGMVAGNVVGLWWPNRYEPTFAEPQFDPEVREPRPSDDEVLDPN